nr:uncharacterized protein LOC111413216 [Onthophagus taurus]
MERQYYYYAGSDGGKKSLTVFIVAIVLIIIIVITGLCVAFLVERMVANIILIVLIALLLVIGITSFLYIRKLNKEALLERQVHRTLNVVQPSAPPMSNRNTWSRNEKHPLR